ncbi:MAG: carboxymuconolactone decarboxylase family protein [Pseudomonadota bacterium]|nr:MAG: carboxymuconolactone decarboxylase family protein [Pseudomonadota bacterium]
MKHGYQIYDASTAPLASRELLGAVQKNFGMIPNSLATMAESPETLQAYLTIGELAAKSSLSPLEQQVVMLTVAREHECPYCVPAVATLAKSHGVPVEHVRNIVDCEPLGDDRLDALRSFTSSVVRGRGWVTDEEVATFFRHGYNRRNILELILITAMKSIAIYANHIVDPDLDDAFVAER